MRRNIFILILIIILGACEQDKIINLTGYWRLDYSEQVENTFFPYELRFNGDTLYMTDGNNFKHKTFYSIENDTLEVNFSNGNKLKVKFQNISDSSIVFDKVKFRRFPSEYSTFVQSYDLVNIKTTKILLEDSNVPVIHLIKVHKKIKVILNDVTSDLNDIPNFLDCNSCAQSSLYLYIGKGIEFGDLVEAYKWVQLSGINHVFLIIGNKTYEKFYTLEDYININESLMNEFIKQIKTSSLTPRLPKIDFGGRVAIRINNSDDFSKLMTIKDSSDYLILIGSQIELVKYFELIERTKNRMNVKREITAYNKGYT